MTLDGKSKISRPLARKGGVALESRKALNDITNKSSIHPEATSQSKKTEKKRTDIVENGYLHQHVSKLDAPSKKNISVNEKLNIAEEGFLHDHSKCIKAHKAAESEPHFWDTVLPGHGNLFKFVILVAFTLSFGLVAWLEISKANRASTYLVCMVVLSFP